MAVTCSDATNDFAATFVANAMIGRADEEPRYKWTVSGGTIARGQGTSSIDVNVDNTVKTVTATVEVLSFPKECNNKASCSTRVVPSRYPKHWWEWVYDNKKPDWEILPQEAGPDEVILSKRNELGLLSNFAPTPFVFHHKRYASLEGFWQAMLYPEGPNDPRTKFPGLEWKYTREQVTQMTSFEAKHAGDLAEENMRQMGINWVSFEGRRFEYRPRAPGEHYRLIVAATWAKVNQNPDVKKVLLSTGDLILKPDHYQEPNAPAAWEYYEILTQIRAELQKTESLDRSLPLLTLDDLKAGKHVDGPFRISAYVLDIYKCPPCPPPNQCKPCIPDNIVVTDDMEAKDVSHINRLRIYTDKTDQFEQKKRYMFTVKIKGNAPAGRAIESVELVSFEAVK